MSSTFKGKVAEDLALRYLVEQGYAIKARNYRYQKAEIDIIAFDDPFLVFIEVKSRRSKSYGYPEQAINSKKLEMIELGILGFLQSHDYKEPFRIDVISILFDPIPRIEHFKDISMD
jgi:putative endonuclease